MIVNAIVYSPVLISSGIIQIPYVSNIKIPLCDISSLPYWQVFNLISFMQILSQFLIMTLISLVILRMLFKSRQTVEASMGRELRKRRSRDIKFSVTCFTMNLLFGIMRLPILIMYYLYTSGTPVDLNGLYVAIVLFFFDFSIGFVVFFISNKMFRSEFFVLFRLRASSSLSTTIAGGNTKQQAKFPTQINPHISKIQIWFKEYLMNFSFFRWNMIFCF